MHIKLAVIAALSYTTSALSVTQDDSEQQAEDYYFPDYPVDLEEWLAAEEAADEVAEQQYDSATAAGSPANPTANSALAQVTSEAWDQATALAQVNETLEKMPNRDVLEWFEALRVDKWNRLAVDPPILLNRDEVTLTSDMADDSEIYNIFDAREKDEAVTVYVEHSRPFDIDFKFNDGNTRRVTGFLIESGSDDVETLSPNAVKVSWDNETNKPTKSVTFELNFTDEHQELYFDLPVMDITDMRFTFANDDGETEINQIELFGPSDETTIQCNKEEEDGEFVYKNWWVYGPPAETPDAEDQCVRATRVTTTSGCYVDSWVWEVPEAECCDHADDLPDTRLDKAQLKKAC